jgi:RimJ/RimL family protein N-acetyltransferase
MSAPTLETPRLLIRPWRDRDIESWVAMNADPLVMHYFPEVHTRERSERGASILRHMLERRGYGWWIVEEKFSMRFAGSVALQEIPFEADIAPAFEIGWRFLPGFWGQGYATEAARALLRFAFEDLAKREVVAMTATVNLPSRRVMERIGMTRDPNDDFMHPLIKRGHPLQHHVLYRTNPPSPRA